MKWLVLATILALPVAALLASHLSHRERAAPLPRLIAGSTPQAPTLTIQLVAPAQMAEK